MKNTKKYESGRSLVEMIGVLALMGLVTAAALMLMRSGMGAQKRSQASDEIDIMVSSVRAMAAQAYDTDTPFASLPVVKKCAGGNSDPALNLAKALLKSKTGATPLDKDSKYAVYTTDKGQTFTIELANIGADECQSMAGRSYSQGTGDCCEDSGTTVVITFKQ